MILYFAAGLILTSGVMRIYMAVLGGGKTHDRLGSLINVFVYAIAVFFPFNYLIGVVLFGFGVLFMLSLSFEASYLKRILATITTFVVLIAARVSVGFVGQNIEGLILFILVATIFFAVSSIAFDIRIYIDKKNHQKLILDIQEKNEQEKNKLISTIQMETNGLKKYTEQHVKNTLKMLELYKLADVEASLKDLIARNRTEMAGSDDNESSSIHTMKV